MENIARASKESVLDSLSRAAQIPGVPRVQSVFPEAVLSNMNFTTENNIPAINVTTIDEQNESSLQTREIDILGPPLFYAYQALHSLEGIFAIVFNLITAIAIYRYLVVFI